MFIKMNKSGLYVISDHLPDDAVEVTADEYNRVMHPTAAQRRMDYLLGPADPRDKRRYLFETLRGELLADGSFEEDPGLPFYEGMTVDEIQLEYARYVGDDDDRAARILAAKGHAKAYVRNLVASLVEEGA